jgi:release factor glutamine methyltransferase
MPNVTQALTAAAARLHAARVEAPRREARLLLAHALGCQPNSLPDEAEAPALACFESLVARREQREPLALITGTRGFWTLELEVSAETLIPRPDSETLIEAAIAAFPIPKSVQTILDLGTGTGCLLLAALVHFHGAFGLGLDLSPAAAALAARNAAANGLATRTAFLAGNWSAPLALQADLILCNPPYIPTADIDGLMPEVARFEPRSALDGGADGLGAYRLLMRQLPDLLAEGGVAILELGVGQARSVVELAENAKFGDISLRPDLAGVPRALILGDPRKKPFGIAGARR